VAKLPDLERPKQALWPLLQDYCFVLQLQKANGVPATINASIYSTEKRTHVAAAVESGEESRDGLPRLEGMVGKWR
jgi:hypothetical protein